MNGVLHIVGAGLAGLSTALHAVNRGTNVRLYEGAGQAGGRCRSYHDTRLGRVIDNGNHLVLSGNSSFKRFRKLAGAPADTIVEARSACFPFVDLQTQERWHVAINDGPLPWWPFVASRRPKGVSMPSMLASARLLLASDEDTISSVCPSNEEATSRFWEPMAMAVVNLPPDKASARLMRATMLEVWRDGRRARPIFAPKGWGAALVEPALKRLEALGAPVAFGHLLKGLRLEGARVAGLEFARSNDVALGPDDKLVLAVPAHRLAALLPDADLPTQTSSILNAHFLLSDHDRLTEQPPILGVVGGLTQWIFLKGDIISLTISAAEFVEGSEEAESVLLEKLWRETISALGLSEDTPYKEGRLVREKRATFLQTPENVKRRPPTATRFTNLFLAGDFVDTGLPATIESAVRSGEEAARLAA